MAVKVLGISTSPRAKGNTELLLRRALAGAEAQGAEVEYVSLRDYEVVACIECNFCFKGGECKIKDDYQELSAKMLEADGIILGSPTYFADLSTELKAVIDRAGFVARANGNLFRRKVGAAIVAVRRTGAIHAFDSINHFFLISEMIIPGSSYWNIGFGLKKGDAENDEEGLQTMQQLGKNMAWLLKKTNA